MLPVMIGEDPQADIRWLEGLSATRDLVVDEASLLVNSHLLLDRIHEASELVEIYSRRFGDSEEFAALQVQLQFLSDFKSGLSAAEASWVRGRISLNSLVKLLNLQGFHEESIRLLSGYLRSGVGASERQSAFAALSFAALNCQSLDPVAWRVEFERLVGASYPVVPESCGGGAGGTLRIGFIGSALHYHPIANFVAPLFHGMKACGVQLFVFSNGICRDQYQDLLRSMVDEWQDVANLDDSDLFDLMLRKKLDVLVDLDNHTRRNRFGVIRRRVAPYQVALYGLNSTTGLSSVDYRICDEFTDPPGVEAQFSEKLLRLPITHIAYDALAPVPRRELRYGNGVRIGVFNSWHKINLDQIRFFSKLLRSESRAQLVLGGIDDGVVRQWLINNLKKEGADLTRVEIHSFLEQKNFFALAQTVDFAMDSWPWGGGATTAALLNLGVPVLTRAGSRPASRIGASLLWGCGFGEWVIDEDDDLHLAVSKKINDAHAWRRRSLELQPTFAKSFGVNAGCGKRFCEALANLCRFGSL